MLISSVVAAMLALSPESFQSSSAAPPPVELGDVVVSGKGLGDEVQSFVDEVAAPPPKRGLARWRGRLCISTVNIGADVARPLIDHIATIADSHGVRPSRILNCRPNVVIMFTDNGRALASALVENQPAIFYIRWTRQADRGRRALQAFQDEDAPVRWWHLSMPVIGLTGDRAIRMPGDTMPIRLPGEGLVNRGRPIGDDLLNVVIVVDLSKTGAVSLPDLGDYLAMISLAQVDPDGETAGFDTVLNLFDGSGRSRHLSGWDQAYLTSLYGAYYERINPYDQASSMTRGIRRQLGQPGPADDQ